MSPRPASAISGLYLLTRETADSAALLDGTAAAVAGGARVVQYRDKSADPERRHAQATALAALCHAQGVPLIINDDVDLARRVGADGVHLGAGDATVAAARAVLGTSCIIGVSCYDDESRARRAVAEGADYLAYGAFFASGTKPLAGRAPLTLLESASRLGRPVVAIGGIDAHNGGRLVAAGASALAVLGAVWDAADMRAAARAISSLFPAQG